MLHVIWAAPGLHHLVIYALRHCMCMRCQLPSGICHDHINCDSGHALLSQSFPVQGWCTVMVKLGSWCGILQKRHSMALTALDPIEIWVTRSPSLFCQATEPKAYRHYTVCQGLQRPTWLDVRIGFGCQKLPQVTLNLAIYASAQPPKYKKLSTTSRVASTLWFLSEDVHQLAAQGPDICDKHSSGLQIVAIQCHIFLCTPCWQFEHLIDLYSTYCLYMYRDIYQSLWWHQGLHL